MPGSKPRRVIKVHGKKTDNEDGVFIAYRRVADIVRNIRKLTEDARILTAIERYKAYTDGYEAAVKLLKEAIRPKAVVGQRVQQMFEDDGTIAELSVLGINKPDAYDDELAYKHWPENIRKQVMTVSPQKVKRLIEEGLLSEKIAHKALLPVVNDTPRVSIKLLDPPRKKTT